MDPGADPGFWEGGSEHRDGSLKQGVWGAHPRSYRVFPFYSTKIMPKYSCLFEEIQET